MLGLLEIIVYLLVYWRFGVSVMVSITMALILSSIFIWFTAGICITLVLFGAAFGLLWQGRNNPGIGLAESVPPTTISKSVACLGFAFTGLVWGGAAAFVLNSVPLAAVALALSVALVVLWYRFILHRNVSKNYLVFATASLFAGFSSPLLLNLLLLKISNV